MPATDRSFPRSVLRPISEVSAGAKAVLGVTSTALSTGKSPSVGEWDRAGFFDRSRIRATEARVRAGDLELQKVRDDVARQVVEASARVTSIDAQLEIIRRALKDADESFRLFRERRELGVGVVLETIQSEQDLTRARLDYVTLLAEHNKAQYALQHAIGGTLTDSK